MMMIKYFTSVSATASEYQKVLCIKFVMQQAGFFIADGDGYLT
jgi:hypothetical protein